MRICIGEKGVFRITREKAADSPDEGTAAGAKMHIDHEASEALV